MPAFSARNPPAYLALLWDPARVGDGGFPRGQRGIVRLVHKCRNPLKLVFLCVKTAFRFSVFCVRAHCVS